MPGFYPRTTPKSISPPKLRIADLRFAALLDDDDDDDEVSSTISSNNSSNDSLFLHLEEESLLDITRSEIIPPLSPTPSVEEDTDNLLGIMPLDKLDQLQRPKLVVPQDIAQSPDYNDRAEDDSSNISPTTTAINLLPTTTRLNKSYPVLSDTSNNFLDNRTDTINYPIQVEMAKSAFLKNPTPELWNELVSWFHYMMFIKNNNTNKLDDGSQNDICPEEEMNGSTVEFTSDEISYDLIVDNEDEGWATFDDKKDDLMNSTSKISTARLPREETTSTVENQQHHELASFEFIGNVEINEVLSTILSKEEKTMFNQIFPEMTNEKNRNEENVWSEERDVSPPTSPDRICDDECSSSSEYDPDLISLEQSSQEESTTSQLNESIESSEASYVLNEVSHWEKRIDKYDQRYVNVVAAALEEAVAGENSNLEDEWKVGRILEVSPADNEEILYVV